MVLVGSVLDKIGGIDYLSSCSQVVGKICGYIVNDVSGFFWALKHMQLLCPNICTVTP